MAFYTVVTEETEKTFQTDLGSITQSFKFEIWKGPFEFKEDAIDELELSEKLVYLPE